MKLTPRDLDLLETLSGKVRILSLTQIADHWWGNSRSARESARRRLSKLVQQRLLVQLSVLASPLPEMTSPVCVWKPGHASPDFGAAAWRIQQRWQQQPRRTTAYVGSRKTADAFGGRSKGKLKYPFQATHDLGVGQMYLHLRACRPELAPLWIGEDILAPHRKGQKLPDAVLAAAPDQTPQLVLEFGGAYDKPRLVAFHNDCELRGLPYEIW